MYTLSPDQWQALSPHLDEALGMADEERSIWLSSLRGQNPTLADQLERLLGEHRALADQGFLEKLPVRLDGLGLAGQALGVYTLVSQIGQGGMGSVWLGKRSDGRFERKVAIKFLNIALMGKGGEERFKREGIILGRLAHPHIAELIDAGVSHAGQPYLVLEHVEGEHIDGYCDQHRLDVEARIGLFLDVLRAVAQAHVNLIVHRDLKPSNVLVRNDGQVKLLDFGIAKLLEGEGHGAEPTRLTAEGVRAMTPDYAAPEQLTGEAVTTATDVYALGVLLYVLLTGQHPAGAGRHTPAELVKAIVDTEPARPSESVVPARTNAEICTTNAANRATTPYKLSWLLCGDLDTIIAKALKKDFSERYPSVTALADDLRRYLKNQPISARPDRLAYRAAKFVSRNRTAVAFATLAVIATLAGVVGTLIQTRTARAQRDFALRQVERSEALNEFHEFLLSDAAPSGKPFTVNELLRRAERIVERQHTVTDPNRIKLMISIGRQYMEQDEGGSARRVLEDVYKLSRGLSDPSVRAEASCTLAASLARDEELSRAELLFQEGLRELPKGPQFTLERIDCLHNGSEIAQEGGDLREGIARAQAAQRVLQQSPFDSEALELHRWTDLAMAYNSAGQDLAAVSAFERAGALLSSLGRDDTQTAVTLFNNWALELDQLGRPIDAEKMYRHAIDISSASQSEDTVSPMVLNNYAKSLRELGRLKEAEDYAERAYAKAQRVGHQLVINQSLLERARIYNARRNPSRAAAMLAEVEPRLRQSLPAGHYAFASLASEQALVALANGDLQAALKFAEQGVTIDEAAIKAGGLGAFYLPTLLIRRSAIGLEAGHHDEAAADAARALGLLRGGAEPGTFSAYVGRANLALGRALRAEGKGEEARAAFRSAAQHLQATLGPSHPDTRRARQMAESETLRR
jgi:serine/threonine-protein kinase